MTHLTARDVLAMLTAAERGTYELDVAVTALTSGRDGGEYFSYSRSLDAALSLLPSGWFVQIRGPNGDLGWFVEAAPEPFIETADEKPLGVSAYAKTLAIALCVAAIRARQAIRAPRR
jgi:hypothetical protein